MPWKETAVMDERMEMVSRYLNDGDTISELARWYEVSRKTAYKWITRYAQQGAEGLKERSRAPQRHPHAIAAAVERAILEWKSKKPSWGAPKIHAKLVEREDCPSESTVSNVLARHGLSRPKRRRRRSTPSESPLGHCLGPNEVWCADFKGHFKTGDGRRCDPLTISDGYSRYLLCCRALAGTTGSLVVRPLFMQTFREYGMPAAMRTDNGAPFASVGLGGLSALNVWWLDLGIRLERIEPGCPEQNGRHERMHRTLKEQTACPPQPNLGLQQQVFDAFRVEYNEERPHEALCQQPPGAIYKPSRREYPEGQPDPAHYPEEWSKRTVRPGGRIRWCGQEINITRALCGREVGLQPVGEGQWMIYYRTLKLGLWDARKKRIEPVRRLEWHQGHKP